MHQHHARPECISETGGPAEVPTLYCHVRGVNCLSEMVAEFLWDRRCASCETGFIAAGESNNVPLSKKGWQDAIHAVYPFKINRFRNS